MYSCNSLILNNLLLLKISSFCHMDDLARLASLPTITYPQSYPQLLWVMSYKMDSQNQSRQGAQAAAPAGAVGHNPPQIICLEMCIVFDHTSRGLAYLALGRLLSLGACAGH
ncbi:MAG: hypothetical protein Q7T78_22375 [Rhodoferax sp.]|nr:hypothetical protein [Rhodoferax sp.]